MLAPALLTRLHGLTLSHVLISHPPQIRGNDHTCLLRSCVNSIWKKTSRVSYATFQREEVEVIQDMADVLD